MSQQKRPPLQNNRPRQANQNRPHPQQGQQAPPPQGQPRYPQNPQQGQQPQYPQGQYPPQNRPMPPQAAPHHQQPLPTQQPSQPEKIYIEQKRHPAMMVLKVLAFPFVKLFQLIGNVFTIILQELVRSIVSFIFGIILLILFVVLVAGYIYALIQTDFNFAAAVPEMFNIFASFFGFGG